VHGECSNGSTSLTFLIKGKQELAADSWENFKAPQVLLQLRMQSAPESVQSGWRLQIRKEIQKVIHVIAVSYDGIDRNKPWGFQTNFKSCVCK